MGLAHKLIFFERKKELKGMKLLQDLHDNISNISTMQYMYKAVLQRRNKASVYGKGPSWKNTSQAFA
jgi:hypothetical protein